MQEQRSVPVIKDTAGDIVQLPQQPKAKPIVDDSQIKLKSSTLVGNAKATFSQGRVDDTRLMQLINEAAKGSEYSWKEEKKLKECEYKVRKYKAKVACMKSNPEKWTRMQN